MPPALARPTDARPKGRAWRVALAGLAIFVLALVPRLVGLEQHLTADDQDWVRRASRFAVAVQQGRWRETYQSGHPGVTVLGLATLAMGPERSAALAARAGDLGDLEKSPAYLAAVFDTRRALALVSAGLTALLALLAWRLLGPAVGLLAGLLLASEPFLVAHGRLFHTDPLLAQLMTASALAALVFFQRGGGPAYLVGSGVAAGLALLTKAPAVLLLGFVPLVGLGALREHGCLDRAGLVRLAAWLLVWGLAAGGLFLLLWPALWVDPLGTLHRLMDAVRGVGESPRRWGNFFLGQAVPEDVGPLFYPFVTVLRLSPITLAGLLLLVWPLVRRRQADWRPAALALLDLVVLFTLMMSLSPKKLDRYLLPVYPPLAILAALGLGLALGRWRPGRRWPALLAVGLGQAALVAATQPYPLSFFDPLLGGLGLARQTVIVGWGEGTDQAAAYLDAQPNAANLVATSLYNDLINAQFRGTAVPLWEWQKADYLVDYVNMDQRNLVPGPLREVVRRDPPVFTARIGGLEYARVYRIPPELKARSGSSGASRGADVPRP